MSVPYKYKPQYLERIRVSRGIRRVGELFAFRFRRIGYIFGRVVRNDCACEASHNPRPWKRRLGNYLVYIYQCVGARIDQVPELRRDKLLIPPQMIVGTGWSRGYFVPIGYNALTEDSVLPVHCFWIDDVMLNGRQVIQYVDEYGNILARRTELCEVCALGDHGSIEGQVAAALGLPYRDWTRERL